MYLTNDVSGAVGQFARSQTGWSESTQEEIDVYLLVGAKASKRAELSTALTVCCDAGFTYSGDTFCVSSDSIVNFTLKDSLLGYESDNVSVNIDAAYTYVLPTGHGVRVDPGQKITVLGFTDGANNGVKTVYGLEGNFLIVDETLVAEAAGDDICVHDANRYKFYDTDGVLVDFANLSGWNVAFSAIMGEKDRVMIYYCSTKKEIADCTTLGQVDAITIDFSA